MNIIGPECHTHGVRGYGNPGDGVMLIGIAPGKNEVAQGKPFVGESGRLLDAVLKAVSWDRSKVYCTNLHCQWDDAPSPAKIAACAARLRREITVYKPRIIVPLGKLASEQVISEQLFGNTTGAVLWRENVLGSGHSCYVIPTFHPAAILYGMSAYIHDVWRDLRRIKTVIDWPTGGSPYKKVEYSVAQSTRDVQDFLDDMLLLKPDYLALDIESAEGKDPNEVLDPFSDKLLCVGLSDGVRTLVVPEEFCHGLDWNENALNWTLHFSTFDCMGMRQFLGVKIPVVHDTLLMSYACDERTGVHSLKKIVRERLGVGFYEADVHTQARKLKGFQYVDKAALYEYNARDAAYTARVAPILYQEMADDDQLWPYHNIMIPTANAFMEMQYRGVRVDMKKLNELELRWYPRWIDLDTKLRAYGVELGAPAPFNPDSNVQLKRLVFDILGIKSPTGKVSKITGALSLDKEVLEALAGTHPFIDHLQDFRDLGHQINNYMFVVRDHMKMDGCLHATPKQHGAVTYRTSYINPPLQTIPNPKYESNGEFGEFRQIFVPSDKDHVIVEADFSKAELYWAVMVSGDEVMRADLESGDFHSRVASDIFNKPISEVTKWDRTRSKHVTFGIMYGRGAYALARAELKCSVTDAEVFLNRWRSRYSVYMTWFETTRRKAIKEKELTSFTGRKRRFKIITEGDYDMLNKAVNFPIQCPASDTTLMAMVRLQKSLTEYDSSPIIMIHDALVFDVSRKHLDTCCALIKRTMESPQFEGAIPIAVEVSVGDNWGDTHEI